jgi:hypothetical protein
MIAERRYALVTGPSHAFPNEDEAARIVGVYLPDNYEVEGVVIEQEEQFSVVHPGGIARTERFAVVVSGRDHAGWTLDSYVIPRLGSGSFGATEIDLSHPALKAVPL